MRRETRNLVQPLLTSLLCLLLTTPPASDVFADTDGSEILIVDQPDKLILQLGSRWAGVEFELGTDSGVFPVPIVADANGVLKMDLGGSKTYTLSCLASSVPIPEQPAETAAPSPNAPSASDGKTGSDSAPSGVPIRHMIFPLVGLAAAAGGLLVLRFFKRRRDAYDYDEDEDDDE
jgi:hypothetical protein